MDGDEEWLIDEEEEWCWEWDSGCDEEGEEWRDEDVEW